MRSLSGRRRPSRSRRAAWAWPGRTTQRRRSSRAGPAFDLAALDGTNGFELIGRDSSAGFSVSSAGDVNSDGFDDLIIGSPSGDGVSYVVFGGNFNSASVQVSAHPQLTELETIIGSG